ncbi:unnamed protein product, partial [Porites lobata]
GKWSAQCSSTDFPFVQVSLSSPVLLSYGKHLQATESFSSQASHNDGRFYVDGLKVQVQVETDNKPPVFNKLWTENICHQDGSADVCGHSLERVDYSSGTKVSDLIPSKT